MSIYVKRAVKRRSHLKSEDDDVADKIQNEVIRRTNGLSANNFSFMSIKHFAYLLLRKVSQLRAILIFSFPFIIVPQIMDRHYFYDLDQIINLIFIRD